MDVILNSPVQQAPAAAPPAVAQVQLLQADYSFTNATISLAWNELDSTGNYLNGKSATLSTDQTTAFFATPVASAATLHDVFQAAFLGAVEGIYGAGTAVDTVPTPASPPASPPAGS